MSSRTFLPPTGAPFHPTSRTLAGSFSNIFASPNATFSTSPRHPPVATTPCAGRWTTGHNPGPHLAHGHHRRQHLLRHSHARSRHRHCACCTARLRSACRSARAGQRAPVTAACRCAGRRPWSARPRGWSGRRRTNPLRVRGSRYRRSPPSASPTARAVTSRRARSAR